MNVTTKSPNYLVRNPYSYCFRLVVPKDLQPFVGKKELRYSLKTGYIGLAKQKSRFLAGHVQMIFRYLRKDHTTLRELSKTQIQDIVNKYFRKALRHLDDGRLMLDENDSCF